MDRPAAINRTIQEADIWLNELREDMQAASKDTAYASLRAVLHELRDRLTVDEAAQLAAQLPMLVCGLYFNSWKPAANPTRVRTVQEFLDGVRDRAPGHEEIDPDLATRCVFALLARHVSPGEIDDVIQQLPTELRALWTSPRAERNAIVEAAVTLVEIDRGTVLDEDAGRASPTPPTEVSR
ncbi:DUF2267 domain-containing protein [Azospirillum sp. Vi22]|uniref:DUF2267 domain-containing protein n=1 Tax=Azospirillum baldaniorum TaxID=1064539 RepID=UPI00157A61F7|nr:DUF2267 domain-containing protein [Azospirillum baldaniorum]NUB07261.1 DUF2267 domain-containing protein [Azospirillum baldaniorum]